VALGGLHALAGMTKAIAFPSLLVLPIGYAAICLWSDHLRHLRKRASLRRVSAFLLLYAVPLVSIAGLWSLACHARYGRLTLGGTASFNYELYTRESDELRSAIETARQTVTPGQSFWWSDPTRSVRGWEGQVSVNLTDQLEAMYRNTTYYVRHGGQLLRAAGTILILLIPLLVLCFRKLRSNIPWELYLAALVAAASVLLYLNVVLYPRHLTFPALFCLPLFGVVVRRLTLVGRGLRCAVVLALTLLVAQGVSAMIYASEILAPRDSQFRIAEAIKRFGDGPIGVSLDGRVGRRSYGTIAFLASTEAAELVRHVDDDTNFEADFTPGSVLWIGEAELREPASLMVNERKFYRFRTERWKGGSTWAEERIAVYLPEDRRTRAR
jgi:hypothetical protein